MSNVQCVTRNTGEFYRRNQEGTNIAAFDVSGYADHPFNLLSPFTHGKEIEIPIPGMQGRVSHSVEGIWQGLKIINGSTEERLFSITPRKRKGFVEGHRYGEQILDIPEARERIYIPSYTFFLDNFASQDAIEEIGEQQRMGKRVFVYDVDSNADIRNPAPLAHASVLATYLNLKIFSKETKPRNNAERQLFAVLHGEGTLEEKVMLLEALSSDPEMKRAVQYHCKDHPLNPDTYHIGLACTNI